jgi:TadE-like protein
LRAKTKRACNPRRCEAGTAAIEFSVVAFAMILVSLGLIEFARGLHVRNEVSFAADFAARKILTNTGISNTALETEVRSHFEGPEPDLLQVTLGTETVEGVQFRTVALTYPFTLLIPDLISNSISLKVDRRIPIIQFVP